jgi:hypothetical protein
MALPAHTAADPATAPVSRSGARIGRMLTALLTLFLLFDSAVKLIQLPPVVEATVQMGFPAYTVPVIGAVLLVCVVLYVVPRTAVLGAVLLTGYLGGAVCAQMRIEAPLLSTVLFPVYLGVVVWIAVYLRSGALRALVRASL